MRNSYNVYMGESGYGKTNFELKTTINVLENRINKAIHLITHSDITDYRVFNEELLEILRGEDK